MTECYKKDIQKLETMEEQDYTSKTRGDEPIAYMPKVAHAQIFWAHGIQSVPQNLKFRNTKSP